MSSVAQPQLETTVQFNDALLAATDAALAAAPEATARILKGYALVQADAVTDMQHVRTRWFTVRSARNAETVYNVESNGHTTCDCQDYQRHSMHDQDYCCKHVYSVLLLRKARTLYTPPLRKRLAYHLYYGVEGHARLLPEGTRAQFWPGGTRHSFPCDRADLCVGRELRLDEYPG